MEEILICPSSDVTEGGKGTRFNVSVYGEEATAFVIRFEGEVHAYLNRCAHVPVELDWAPGEFFEGSGLYIMCATHGAIYTPNTGHCEGGPCRGANLKKIVAFERDGDIFWCPDKDVTAVIA